MVLPILKKTSLDAGTLSNYRPISNLSFDSKLVERVVLSQIGTYLTNNNLYPRSQSAYRKHHSTETVLIKAMNDIGSALDDGIDVPLVLVDLSSAFDTVDHQIFLERLQFKYGMSGSVLSRFKSYLSERYRITHIDRIRLSPRLLNSGVPQGSVLGPLLFSLYISPIEDIIDAHGLHSILYAGDNQCTCQECTCQLGRLIRMISLADWSDVSLT